jgi:8-oxo-dGTP diphosphatase
MHERYKIAIVAVIDGDGHLLMIRRVNGDDSNAGKWEFPAGHVDGGERPEIAAVREVFEETGLEIYLMPWSIDLPTKAGKAAQFLGFVANGDIKPEPNLAEDEHDRHVWIKAHNLSKIKPTHKNMGENLTKLLKKAKIGLNGEPLKRNASRRKAAETGQPFSGMLYRGIEPDPDKARRDRIPSQFAVGAYWTDNPEIAETYGSEVISRDITLNNPYVLTLGEKAYFQELKKEFGTHSPDEITKKLLREGYDGLIVKNVPIQRRKPDGEYIVMRDSTEYILFNRRASSRRRANQLLPMRVVRHLPEPADDLREAILVGDEVEIFLKDQASRGDDSAPEVSGIVDRRNRNTLWIRPVGEEEDNVRVKSPLTWKNDGNWAFIRVYRDPDQVIHYVKGNPYDPDGKTMERAKGIGLILETNPPDRFESVFALMRNETPDLDRSMGQAPQSFDEVAPFNKPRPGIPPILHRVREVLRDSGLEPDLVDHVGNGRVMILTQDSDMKKDIVRVLQKGGVEVKAGRRGDLIATEGRRRLATGVGGTTTIPIETDDEMMRPTIVQRKQNLQRERERKAERTFPRTPIKDKDGDRVIGEIEYRLLGEFAAYDAKGTRIGKYTSKERAIQRIHDVDAELMRRLKGERERKAQGTMNPQPVNPTQNLTPNPSITMVTDPAKQVQTLQKYGTPEVLPGNKGIQMTFDSDEDMKKFKTDMVNNPMVQFAKTGHREKRQAARYFIQGFRRAMRQGDYGSAGEFLTRLLGIGIQEESIVKSRLVGRRGWQELDYHATGIGDLGISRLSRRASRLAPDL